MRSDAFVQFGASGDLAKKMTFVSLYRLAARGLLDMPIVGVAADDWDDDTFRAHARESIEAEAQDVDEAVWKAMAARMTFVHGDFGDPALYAAVGAALGGCQAPLFYLEIPPSLFLRVVQGLHGADLLGGTDTRVVVEKPFGHDLASAKQLSADLGQALRPEQLYRIDHYLGKNAVQDIMVWRFANRLMEPLWNAEHIDSVQITMAESFGVADRGRFYDSVGALKDVVQNHLLQVVSLLAMEPPTRNTADAIHAEQLKVLDAIRPVEPDQAVRGQYQGYLDVDGVAPGSTTESYVALRLAIDSWRWSGVPFLLRAGKCLGTTATEALVRLRLPPLHLFDETDASTLEHNHVRLRIGPRDGVRLELQAKDPVGGLCSKRIALDVDFGTTLGSELLPYELLLGEAIDGDPTSFATEAMVEGMWSVVEPVVEHPGPVHAYAPGCMGPAEADALAADHGGWIDPILPPTPG